MTTILAIRKGNKAVMCGDGQVSFGNAIIKSTSKKVKRIVDGTIVVGYAGSASDGMALLERLEMKLNQYSSQLMRACIELAKDWRTDKYLRRLEAMLIVVDSRNTFIITGSGDVLEPEHGVAAIGSGGNYAMAAARAMLDVGGDLDIVSMAHKAMGIAADICVFTNNNLITEILEWDEKGLGLATDQRTDIIPVPQRQGGLTVSVDDKDISIDDIYSLTAVIAAMSKEISVEYVIERVRAVYPRLRVITLKIKQAIKRLLDEGIIKKSDKANIYLSMVRDFEALKGKNMDLSRISDDALSMLRKLSSH